VTTTRGGAVTRVANAELVLGSETEAAADGTSDSAAAV
jgi:hypothetical protein